MLLWPLVGAAGDRVMLEEEQDLQSATVEASASSGRPEEMKTLEQKVEDLAGQVGRLVAAFSAQEAQSVASPSSGGWTQVQPQKQGLRAVDPWEKKDPWPQGSP